MRRLGFFLAVCVMATLLPACGTGADLTAPDQPRYNGGMAGSGGYESGDDGIGMGGSGGVSAATSDTTGIARGIGMAGSGG